MKKATLVLIFVWILVIRAWSWSDHDQLSYLALATDPFFNETVVVEELGSFLEQQKTELAPMLSAYEAWAAENLKAYSPRPSALSLDPDLEGEALVASFLGAIRVNPDKPYELFIQPSGWGGRTAGREPMAVAEVDVLEAEFPNSPFETIASGDRVRIVEVIASASDEPDYGMDVGLYDDNGTDFGSAYGFGIQPFGNPALDYGSQAPFHMSFPHEDPIIKAAAPFVSQGLSEYRVALFTALARFAMDTGHDYWGWRFAGWALHYIQDLAQPYHARLMPGKSTAGLLALYVFGSDADIDGAIVLLSNRHLAVEEYLYRLVSSYVGDDALSPVFSAIKGARGDKVDQASAPMPFRAFFATDEVARISYNRGSDLDRLLARAFPARYVSDAGYDYGADPDWKAFNPFEDIRTREPAAAAALEESLAIILADLGTYTRSYVDFIHRAPARSSADPYEDAPPRRKPVDLRGLAYSAMALLVLVAFVLLVLNLVRLGKRLA
jgi:hypothetical protein